MRITFALLAGIAGCATTTSRQSQYDTMLAELRRDDPRAAIDARVAAATTAATLDRRALIAAVLSVNRDVESMRQGWRAAIAAVPGASSLGDPMVSYSIAPLSIGSDAPFGQRIELSQKLPFPGKRRFATDVAIADAEVMRGDLRTTQLMVAELTSQLFDDAWVNARAKEITDHHGTLLEQMRKVADARLASGRGSAQDALQAEVELGLLEREQLMLETERIAIAARINGLLHREPDAPLPPLPAELAIPAAPPPVAAVERIAIDVRPQKASADAKLAGAQAGARGAERAYYPDLELMASYDSMWDLPEHRWMFGVGIEIPIQRGKRAADVGVAKARVAQAQAVVERTVDDIRVDVARTHRELVEALAVVTLYDVRLLPASHAQVDAALAGFTTGQNDFPAVIQAERGLREIQLAAFRARADAWRRSASLDRAAGRTPGGAP